MIRTDALPIDIQGLTFAYPGQPADRPILEEVTLQVEPRDFLGIIGPNGSGKTTLLKLILGLLEPQQGTISIFGLPPDQARQHIGYVPQRATINAAAPATVLDIVLMGRLARSSWGFRYGRRDIEAAQGALQQVGCADLAPRVIAKLSGGQRQRVLVARTLAADAQLLLLDEPMSGVDEPMQVGLTELLHELNERLPIVVVSHDIGFVSSHVKHVACLSRRLTWHKASDVTEEVIARMYEGPVSVVHHHHEAHCPILEEPTEPGLEERSR